MVARPKSRSPSQVPAHGAWRIDDAVTQLRVWGTGDAFELPRKPVASIGSVRGRDVVLRDPAGEIAHTHALLVREGARWMIRAAEGATSIRLDGLQLPSFALAPGAEIGVGAVTLVAESARLHELRRVVAELAGIEERDHAAIDRALRAIRLAVAGRRPLLLCGQVDLVAAARQLHEHTLGDAPFAVVDRAGTRGHHRRGLQALAAAGRGTVCVSGHSPPTDFDDMLARWHGLAVRPQLVLCRQVAYANAVLLAEPLELRPRKLDRDERAQLIEQRAAQVIAQLGADPERFTEADRRWILKRATSPDEIETATLRVISVRHWGSVTRAAHSLGISHVALLRWIGRRAELPGTARRSPAGKPKKRS
ncbi:MAG: FHA domain-containing protein [Kofleriaceae bacterium]